MSNEGDRASIGPVPPEILSADLHDGSSLDSVHEVVIILLQGPFSDKRAFQTCLSLGNLRVVVPEELYLVVDRILGGDGVGLGVQVESGVHQGDNVLLVSGETSSELVTACAASTPCTLGGNDHSKIVVFITAG